MDRIHTMARFDYIEPSDDILHECTQCGDELLPSEVYFYDEDYEVTLCSRECAKEYIKNNIDDYVDIVIDSFEEA